ncbi:MAG: DUF1211 domain-containing protein [Candidatus Micrarchaeota archaeon]|nr:DUF1211 domain-containing protein [Candidatus Micrarchaeota archaeon]MDE1847679.1 DUF1211 domain-containing protein [Candidatus Micrarchaeota archaeon]MDE1864500.1 DUF1211 domain-containing protein [Candidatus Micrarchaeota archaeon]
MAEEDVHTIRGFTKDRAEALTDGIFATVMTILILSLVVPVITSGNVDQMLSADLISLVPNVVTYVMSFLVLGTIWIGHNNIFRYLERAESKVQWINMAFLLGVGFIPFTTALLGRYPFDHIASLIYGINLLGVAIVYNFFFGYALMEKLLHREVQVKFFKTALKRSSVGILVYLIGIIFSFVNPEISLGLYIIMPIYYMALGTISGKEAIH